MRSLVIIIGLASTLTAAEPSAAEVFEKRLLPIFKSPTPSSCVQCHLAGVDLKNYILPDAESTFRSLRDQGLIDLKDPAKSKIVTLIDMGGGKGPEVHAKNRKSEREAFLAWITACAADPKLTASPKLEAEKLAQPPRPVEVIRHARKDRVLESFEVNVWSWRFRCMNCHAEGTPQNEKHRKEYGDRVAWVKKAGAEATLEYLIESKLIDVAKPENSLLLRKPLGEKHEGGVKFAVGDEAYKGFRAWIEDVAKIRGDKYAKADELPKAGTVLKFGTDTWIKLSDCPPAWQGKLVQVQLFAKTGDDWSKTPIAISDRPVAAKSTIWQHNLTLLADKGSENAKAWQAGKPKLAAGEYLVRVWVDGDERLKKDWTATLDSKALVGQAAFEAKWRDGYGGMTTVNASLIRPLPRTSP